jgi:hypothetical protein
MKFVKICFVGGRCDAVKKDTLEVPIELLQLVSYPEDHYEEDLVDDFISEDEWTALVKMVKTGERFSGLLSIDEFDVVYGMDESDYGQMKQVMLDGWEDPEYYNDPEYGQRIMKTLDTLNWNGEYVDVLK